MLQPWWPRTLRDVSNLRAVADSASAIPTYSYYYQTHYYVYYHYYLHYYYHYYYYEQYHCVGDLGVHLVRAAVDVVRVDAEKLELCVRVRVRVCVGAGRRDDPPRLGRALLGHAGMLYTFTVGLGLGRQRI